MESQYKKSMEKAAGQNLDAVEYCNVYQGATMTALSPNAFKKLAEAAGAKVKIGSRSTRYDMQKIRDYLAEHTGK